MLPDMSSVATSQQALALLTQQDRLTRLAETMQARHLNYSTTADL